MKKIYYILSSFIISIILLLGLQSKAYAASATISASASEIEKGNSVNISADIKSASSWELDIITTGGTLNKSDSRVGNTDSGNNESKTITIGTFSASEAGTYTITLSGYVVDGDTLSKVTVSETVKITVTDPTTGNQDQEPETEPEPETPTTSELEFTNVANKTMYIETTTNFRSEYKINSSNIITKLSAGTEVIQIGISKTQSDGYTWSKIIYNGQTGYVINGNLTKTKPEEDVEEPTSEEPAEETPAETPVDEPTTVDTTDDDTEATDGLKSLEIEGITLSPEFSSSVYEYRIIVKQDVSELTINAVPALEGATVTIAGNTNLKEGENLITIVVYNAENQVATYQITANKNTLDLTDTDNLLKSGTQSAKRNLIIFIVVLAVAIVALVVVMILKRRHEEEYEDDYEEDNEENYGRNNKEGQEFTANEQTVENIKEKSVQNEITEDEAEQEETRRPRREKRKGKHF